MVVGGRSSGWWGDCIINVAAFVVSCPNSGGDCRRPSGCGVQRW